MAAHPSISPTLTPTSRLKPKAELNLRELSNLGLLLGPLVGYLLSLWMVRPLPLSLVTPALLLLTPLVIAVSRKQVMNNLTRVGFEFALLILMATLAVLSIQNSNAPIRSIRIIYPCLVPFTIFLCLSVIGFYSRQRLLQVPRALVFAGIIISVAPFLASLVLSPFQSLIFEGYRLRCFFENAIQHAIALSVTLPIIAGELAISKRWKQRLFWGALFVVVAYTLFRTAAKSPMAISFSLSVVTFVVIRLRSQNIKLTLLMGAALVAGGIFVSAFGLQIAEKLDPLTAEKIRSIIEGGVTNYQSLQSRQLLWDEAIRQGKAHWLVGSGAGEMVLGMSHAHSLVLDYFKGIGLFGGLAILLLCLTIASRAAVKGTQLLRGFGDDNDRRIWACYVAAVAYVLCNQMSDSFGPSTIGFLWVMYLTARLAEGALVRPEKPATRPGLRTPMSLR